MKTVAKFTTILLLVATPKILGQSHFTMITTGEIVEEVNSSYGCAWGDFNGDGLIDLFVANDATPNLFYRNLGDGRFEEMGAMSGCAYSRDGREQSGMGADIADIDHDGLFDLFVANFSDDYNTMYRNMGGGFGKW